MKAPTASVHWPTRRNERQRAGAAPLLATLLLAAAAARGAEPPAAAARVLGGLATGEYDAALIALETAAGTGDRLAARWLGDAYHAGRGVTRDPAAALDWWRRAAAAGDREAAFNAGLLLLRDGRHAEGVELLGEAAATDDALACFVLGTWYARAADDARARSLLECAAQQGYAPAQYNLAHLLTQGETPDLTAARRWYGAAAPTFAPAAAALAALGDDTTTPANDTMVLSSAAPAASSPRDWVLAQRDDAYTIQVAAGRDGAALARLLADHATNWPAAWFMHRPEAREPYSAVVGVFDNYAEAEQVLATLPGALTGNSPWIRRFEVLKRELRAASTTPAAAAATAP
ncbi:MAG: SPOR domain-containing protein [Gammaproteobacteria bacterium]